MKSIKRCQGIMSLVLILFILGMAALVVKIQREASFYMMNSSEHQLGKVYDRNGDILFDGSGETEFEDNYLIDVGNLIGDDKGQMTNTLVARNIERLNNYSFTAGLVENGGNASVHTTIDHEANRKVYDSFGGQDGCAVAYNYKTGEILICTSLPSFDVTKGYDNILEFRSGTLMSKAMYRTVPGSTQKVSTVIAALEIMGADKLFSKTFSCSGSYKNLGGNNIDCHNAYGHGTQNIQQAVENSCNPFFAQLIEDSDFPLKKIKNVFKEMGYTVNDNGCDYINIDGIKCEKASTTLNDPYEFKTQWGCIGQGDTLISPVQLMMWQSAIANESGKMTMPYLISYTTDVYGKENYTCKTKFSDNIFSSGTAETTKQILLTNGENHYSALISGYKVGVKSGTAQVNEGNTENSLLVGFVDDENLPIAFCILIEDKNNTYVKTENIAQVILDSISESYAKS